MTIEEAIRIITDERDYRQNQLNLYIKITYNAECKESKMLDAMGVAIDALEKQIKYQWHDLRKDKEDLPELDKTVIVACDTGYRYAHRFARISFNIHDGIHWNNGHDYFNDVIAWREIEPFEE